MSNKKQESYEMVLNCLKVKTIEKGFVLNPQIIHCDYELAIINTNKKLFPTSRIVGCFFHYCQAQMKYLNDNGLKTKYSNDSTFRSWIRKFQALALLKPESIQETFEEIVNEGYQMNLVDDNVRKYLDYHQQTWSGENATYSSSIWSVFGINKRSNNSIEG